MQLYNKSQSKLQDKCHESNSLVCYLVLIRLILMWALRYHTQLQVDNDPGSLDAEIVGEPQPIELIHKNGPWITNFLYVVLWPTVINIYGMKKVIDKKIWPKHQFRIVHFTNITSFEIHRPKVFKFIHFFWQNINFW